MAADTDQEAMKQATSRLFPKYLLLGVLRFGRPPIRSLSRWATLSLVDFSLR